MQTFLEDLRCFFTGDIRFDPASRRIYSVDASIFELEPLGVILPKTVPEMIRAARLAFRHKIPVIARGAGTGLTGACLGPALIIDCSKYLNNIHQIDLKAEYVICDPGVVQDQLNATLLPHGYRLGPDTSTGNRATLGGMVGNNSAGAYSLKYGKMIDHVIELEVLHSNGEIHRYCELSEEDWEKRLTQENAEGQLYSQFNSLIDQYREEILTAFPQLPRRVSGYNLDYFLDPKSRNLSQLIVGSEGTLGITSQIKLRISKLPAFTNLCILHFEDLIHALEQVPKLLKFKPIALELIDHDIIEMGRISPAIKGQLDWMAGNPQALLIIVFEAQNSTDLVNQLTTFEDWALSKKIGYARRYIKDATEVENVWALRKAGLGLLLSRRTYSRGIAFIEDLAVPPQHIGPFIAELKSYLTSKNKSAGIYGHAGAGLIHVRPYINLRKKEEISLMLTMMHDITDIVKRYEGVLTGEHGDGLIRSWLHKKLFGEKIYQAFIDLKNIFDPNRLINPGKMVEAQSPDHNLRLSPETKIQNIKTFLDFSSEGGFELAVDLCNGNAQCRKHNGIMCPSFQAELDERHSTRARAQVLREIVNGHKPLESLNSDSVYDVLDLCLECKGCKKDCPSQVDMAKIKSEVLYQYHKTHNYSLRAHLFGNIGLINQLGCATSPISNWLSNSAFTYPLLRYLGITTERQIPPFTRERFSQWLKKNKALYSKNKQATVILFNDTYTEFNDPEIGRSAYEVLYRLGYKVIVKPWHCCGRPMISKGLLKQARKKATKLVNQFIPHVQEGHPIIGLEPSCILTIADDFPSLLSSKNCKAVSKACITFDDFIHQHIKNGQLPLNFKDESQQVKVHGHCHQKSLCGMKATMEVLKSIPGIKAEELETGCCGLAGSFGYEAEHYDFSMKIGEGRLFPALRKIHKQDKIIANGLSCRSQILHGVGRKGQHLAELIRSQLNP